MRRVCYDGKMCEALQNGHGGDVHRVPGAGLKGPDATSAKNDLIVAAGHDVLGGKQQLFYSGRYAALEEDRFAGLAQLPQQVEVLHIARPNLENVCVLEQ